MKLPTKCIKIANKSLKFREKKTNLCQDCTVCKKNCQKQSHKNSIIDARTLCGEISFNTMTYKSSETVQRSGYFQSSVSYIKVKSRSHHDVAHLQPLTNVPTKYQLPTPYAFQDIAQTRFSNSRSLWQGQRSNQGHTITLHTYNLQQMSLPYINFLHLTISEIKPTQDFICQGHYGKVKDKIQVTP